MLFSASLILASCCCKKDSASTKSGSENTSMSTEPKADSKTAVLPIQVKKDYVVKETDPFTILDMNASGDTLWVTVQYGGGCKDHEFTMNSNNLWMKSLPPQLTLYLEHKNNGDNCRALITQKLAFDLRAVRFPGGNEMRLFINNDRSRESTYKY